MAVHEPTASTDIADLIAGCAAQDRAALMRLMQIEGSRMLGVATRFMRRADLSEDAVQETFVMIWRRAGQFDPSRGTAKGWIYTILRNRCLTMLRQEQRDIATAPEVIDQSLDDHVLQTAWDRLDTASDLRKCLEALDEGTRHAILSSYVLGLSHGEIAGRMSAPLGSVKSWLRRGLSKLRECMS